MDIANLCKHILDFLPRLFYTTKNVGNNKMNEIFRTRLKYHMQVNRYRLVDVAKGIGVSRQCVQNWRCGRNNPSLNRLEEVATFLNVLPQDLIT